MSEGEREARQGIFMAGFTEYVCVVYEVPCTR